jgi:hypothetical protein
MNSNRLLGLGVLAAVVLAGALLLANHRAGTSLDDGKALYPSLKTDADNIDAVRIFKAGKSDTPILELLRKDSVWTISQRDGYPADATKVRKLIIALTDAKIIEQKTSTPASYPKLGVEDLTADGATGTRIALAGGKSPVDVIVGKTVNRQTYVRRAGEAPSWLVTASIEAPLLVDAWLRRELLDISGDRVQAATIAVGNQDYTATKSERTAPEFKVDGVPKGKELAPAAANSFATALQGLALSEVSTAQAFGAAEPNAKATFKTFDGLVAQLNGWVRDEKRYISIATSYDEAQAKKFELPAAPATPDTESEAGKSEQTKPATPEAGKAANPVDKVRDEATATNQRLTGWVFEIPTYKYDAIFKPVDQLVKKDQPLSKDQLLKK